MGSGSPAFRTERRVFGGTGLFLVPWAILYGVSSDERAGVLLLAGCAVALLVLAGYFEVVSRHVAARPEDEEDPVAVAAPPAEMTVHQAPEISVWPLVMAGAATLLGFGLAFTVWVAIPAGLLLAVGVFGYARET
jgi:hypothetical protein